MRALRAREGRRGGGASVCAHCCDAVCVRVRVRGAWLLSAEAQSAVLGVTSVDDNLTCEKKGRRGRTQTFLLTFAAKDAKWRSKWNELNQHRAKYFMRGCKDAKARELEGALS